jgi:hypothetical protein
VTKDEIVDETDLGSSQGIGESANVELYAEESEVGACVP